MRNFIIYGDILYSTDRYTLVEKKDSYLVVKDSKVVGVFDSISKEYEEYYLYDYKGHLIIPGMSDLHTHVSQYQYRGLYMDMELLDWLNEHTFPEECKYQDEEYAKCAYDIFVDDLLKTSTTRIVGFATIHKDATISLINKLDSIGFAGYIGKVNMDRNSPECLIEDTDSSISDTKEYINKTINNENVKPIITPRFIPTCSNRLLSELGRLSKEYKIPVQSHLSENPSEISWVKELVPESINYADAYRIFSLLGVEKTIMAHCVYTYENELEMVKNKNVYIAHCPDSNTNLYSGIASISKLLDEGVNIGLGSDIAGGESLSLFDAIKGCIKVSKLRYRLLGSDNKLLSFKEAFYLATMLGGSFFGKVGSFLTGYDADIVVLDDSDIKSTLNEELTLSQRAERYTYLSSNKSVMAKFIKGRKVF